MSWRTFGGIFFLWKHQECFVNSEFLVREFEPFFRKISGQNSKVALRATRKTFWGKTSFLGKIFFLDSSDFRRKLSRVLAKKSDRMGNLLWFLCVKGSILKKDGSFKTFIYFAIFFQCRTKTNWVLPEKISMFFKAGFCVPRTTFSGKKEKIEVFSRFIFFEICAETQLTLAKTFQHCCQNFDRRVQRYVFGKFSATKLKGFVECSNFFSKKVPEGLPKLLFTTWQELFGTKTFFHFQTLS